MGEALGDLTGGVVTVVHLDDDEGLRATGDGSIWARLQVAG